MARPDERGSEDSAVELEAGAGRLKQRARPVDQHAAAEAGRPAAAREASWRQDRARRHNLLAALAAVVARHGLRGAALATLSLLLLILLLSQRRQLYRHAQDAAAAAYYGLDPAMLGRSETTHPAPWCCRDEGCAADLAAGHRVAVVTYLRDDHYVPLLRQLECTLRRSNPDLELGLMHVRGELSDATLGLARRLNITLLPVLPLDFANTYEPRYGRNWLKIRALGLTQYHSVLLIDSDTAVLGSLDPLFRLPAEFAAVWDQSRWLSRHKTVVQRINGGVFLLRPCAAVEAHMLGVLRLHPKLRFVHGTAEQDFFSWYFRYTGATLPLHWNCMAAQCLVGNLTVGGAPPRVIHFTGPKPFNGPVPGTPGHQFLCSLAEVEARAGGAGGAGVAAAAAAGAAG